MLWNCCFRFFFLPRPGLNDFWVSLKYEKLLEVCFKCGLIVHDNRFCRSNQKKITSQFGKKFIAFSPWLRSENSLTPPGIYDQLVDLDIYNSDEDPTRLQGDLEHATSVPSRRHSEEMNQTNTDHASKNKSSNGQKEVESHAGVMNLERLMAKALRENCYEKGQGAGVTPSTNLMSEQVKASLTNITPAGTHILSYSGTNPSLLLEIKLPLQELTTSGPSVQPHSKARIHCHNPIFP